MLCCRKPDGELFIVLESVAVGTPEPAFLLCAVKGGGLPVACLCMAFQTGLMFRALCVCPVFPLIIYELNLMVLGKQPRLFAVTAFYQDVRVHHPYPVLLFPDEVFFL